MAQNWSLEQLVGECGELMDKCGALKARAVSFQFPSGRRPVALFNWPQMLEAIEAGNAETEAEAGGLHQHHLSEHAAGQVDRDFWVPFGLVDASGADAPACYGAPSKAGTLYFDLLAVHKGQPTVVWEDLEQKRIELGLGDAFFATLQEA